MVSQSRTIRADRLADGARQRWCRLENTRAIFPIHREEDVRSRESAVHRRAAKTTRVLTLDPLLIRRALEGCRRRHGSQGAPSMASPRPRHAAKSPERPRRPCVPFVSAQNRRASTSRREIAYQARSMGVEVPAWSRLTFVAPRLARSRAERCRRTRGRRLRSRPLDTGPTRRADARNSGRGLPRSNRIAGHTVCVQRVLTCEEANAIGLATPPLAGLERAFRFSCEGCRIPRQIPRREDR